jgi:hypothetical protein
MREEIVGIYLRTFTWKKVYLKKIGYDGQCQQRAGCILKKINSSYSLVKYMLTVKGYSQLRTGNGSSNK